MPSPCARESSGACCNGCCPNPFVEHPEFHSLSPKSPTTAASARKEFKVTTTCSLFPTNDHFTNHESLPSLHESYSNFTKVFPQYSQNDEADRVRSEHYFHLSLSNHVCFDYIGHGLFSYTQLQAPSSSSSSLQLEPPFFDICYKSVNLNSRMQFGGKESELECKVRKRIMAFMNISEEDYTMVFTANQSSAFKLLAESYPFYSNKNLLTVYDYENEAVETMVESSKKRGARVKNTEFSWPNLKIHSEKLMKKLVGKSKNRKKGLFVFPLQSRVSGARYSYLWMSSAQDNGWHVLLDASALGPKDMDTLGLSLFKPDFLICSFYKIFGENPSGFGCLFIKISRASVLQSSTGAANVGIVSLVPAMRLSQVPEGSTFTDAETEQGSKLELQKDNMATSEESELHKAERTNVRVKHKELSFSEIVELETTNESTQSFIREIGMIDDGKTKLECKGLDDADSLGLILISHRARYLINWLVNALMSLRHPYSEHGLPLVRIYGPKVMFDRGPAVAFNIFDWNGEKVDPALVQKLADRYNISLSNGFLVNIWFSDKYEEERERVLERRSGEGDRNARGVSVVTAALGFLTNFEDTYRLWAFVSRFLDADFVEKERWRYLALNQKTIEI
ncbi:molybdenum cofactor sulfurase-like [Pistacia vera]|uniref:molybdenum cofactor sulfurase-like n=1 Tax=Pistacia vera TaxID=55513 RepID=UPI001262B268|nr:molybdenum cofactor sulfurase-like [Pistacia vera]